MGKTIRITAIIAFVLQILYVLAGRIIIPLISGIVYGNRILSFSSDPVKTLLIAMAMFYAVVFLGLIVPLLYLVFMIVQIAASKTEKTGIALEILGIVVFSIVIPVVSTVSSLTLLPLITRLLSNWGTMESYSIYATMNSSGAFLGALSTVALVLMIMSFSFSIARKKWARDDEFEKEFKA